MISSHASSQIFAVTSSCIYGAWLPYGRHTIEQSGRNILKHDLSDCDSEACSTNQQTNAATHYVNFLLSPCAEGGEMRLDKTLLILRLQLHGDRKHVHEVK